MNAVATVSRFLAQQRFLLLFVIVGVGYALGRVQIGGFSLGATASTVLLGVLVSTIASVTGVRIAYPDLLSNVFLYLFMFAVGVRIGPSSGSV